MVLKTILRTFVEEVEMATRAVVVIFGGTILAFTVVAGVVAAVHAASSYAHWLGWVVGFVSFVVIVAAITTTLRLWDGEVE